MIGGRDNKKRHFLFRASDGTETVETQHGNGFGAYLRMMDRVYTVLFAATIHEVRVVQVHDLPDGSTLVDALVRNEKVSYTRIGVNKL